MTDTNLSFDSTPQVGGIVSVRPFRSNGDPLDNPFEIFAEPAKAKERLLQSEEDFTEFVTSNAIPLNSNLVVNLGRQTLAYIVGGKDIIPSQPNPWVIAKASFGSFDTAPRFTDSTLSPQPSEFFTGGENEIVLDTESGVTKKRVTSVDWPQPFLVRFEITLAESEANGILIRELGLWTENETLFARKAIPAINKQQEFGLSFLWRIRF